VIDRSQLKMPAISSESMEVLRILDRDDVDINVLVRAIGVDPILSSTLIKYANSPLHRRAREATSVQQAVIVLGMRQVRAAAMVAAMRGFAANADPISVMLWDQSVAYSTLARAVSQRCCRRLGDEAELVGLLANMGAMVLNTNYPRLYETLAEMLASESITVHRAEREIFGLHRGELMPELAERFRLPARALAVLTDYHTQQVPLEVETDEQRLLAVMWVATYAAWRSPAASNWLREFVPESIDNLLEHLELSDEDVQNLVEDTELLVAQRTQT
jgi:HD-like signal output (HDOD) protein